MAKLKNKKTNVIKEINKEFEASMYLATGEWEIVKEVEEKKQTKPFIINTNSKEEK